MSDTLIIGVPSKGRLQENTNAFFARAGLPVVQARGGRDYRGQMQGAPHVEIAFLSASEIANELGAGRLHFGVTGEDLIREQLLDADKLVAPLEALQFGHANVIVAVPEAWIDVRTMADLDDVATHFRSKQGQRLRVATKYINLTRRFFTEHHVADYRIVESSGATEGAPAAGTAEAIVDITTTGSTLAANGLKVLDDGLILRSQAHLMVSKKATWSDTTHAAAELVLRRISAARLGQSLVQLEIIPPVPTLGLESLFGGAFALQMQEAHVSSFAIPRSQAAPAADLLLETGARQVLVRELSEVFEVEPPLVRRFYEAIFSS
jgi:ATP phosphoribosyltransferase